MMNQLESFIDLIISMIYNLKHLIMIKLISFISIVIFSLFYLLSFICQSSLDIIIIQGLIQGLESMQLILCMFFENYLIGQDEDNVEPISKRIYHLILLLLFVLSMDLVL